MKNITALFILLLPIFTFAQWTQLGQDIDGDMEGDLFSFGISLDAAGDTMAVGATLNDDGGENAGKFRILDWNGSAWVQRGAAILGETGDFAGEGVSLTNDGNTVAVGFQNATNAIGRPGAGIVRVFDWDGTNWTQRGNDMDGEGNPAGFIDGFGSGLSINGD